jgi:polyhydroxyalkanoate synthesis regulator phasin
MRVKRYQNGGTDPIRRRLESERLAADRAGVIDEAMRQNIIPDPRVTGAISVDRPYIFDLMGAGELASLGARGVRALAGKAASRSAAKAFVESAAEKESREIAERNLQLQKGRNFMRARTNRMGIEYRSNDTGEAFLFDGTIDRLRKKGMSETDIQDYIKKKGNTAEFTRGVAEMDDLTKKALDDLKKKQADDQLQNLADRAIKEGSREESQSILNLQQQAQKIIDDLNLAGKIDEIEYNALVDDVENLFNISPGGKASDFPEQFASALSEKLSKYGLEPESVVKKLVQDADKPFMMNQSGGKMKVLHNKKPGMSVSKRMMR